VGVTHERLNLFHGLVRQYSDGNLAAVTLAPLFVMSQVTPDQTWVDPQTNLNLKAIQPVIAPLGSEILGPSLTRV